MNSCNTTHHGKSTKLVDCICRDGDEAKAYLIAHSETYLSQGDAVVNGYREGQDVVCALLV